jgi:hypothetical protein
VKPKPGIFLEFAPISRRYDRPFAEREARPGGGPSHGELLDLLDANLAVFGRAGAQALEYWLDLSRFSGWRREKVQKLPWHREVFLADLKTYAQRGIRHVTSFGAWLDGDYVKRFGEPPIDEYAAGLAGLRMATGAPAKTAPGAGGTVRDRLWIFACAANSDFPHIGRRSVMTPAEGAFYLGVPNIIVVQSSASEAHYGRLEPPFAPYMVALRPLKRVVWSVVGSGGFHSPTETNEILQLARSTANFAGVKHDDFLTGHNEGKRAQWTVGELADFRRRLHATGKRLDIFATLYVTQLDLPLRDYLEGIDVVTLWTGNPAELANLEANLRKADALAPKARKMLGCYMVDYGRKQGLPVASMKLQCETGLRWLREGRIEGMVFLGNTTMDLGFESVEWTRAWIEEVGDTKL